MGVQAPPPRREEEDPLPRHRDRRVRQAREAQRRQTGTVRLRRLPLPPHVQVCLPGSRSQGGVLTAQERQGLDRRQRGHEQKRRHGTGCQMATCRGGRRGI